MNKTIEIGDTFIVEMLQNKKHNGDPICKCNGRVGFLKSTGPNIGETWTVSVVEIKGTFIIVEPVFLEMYKWETEANKKEMLTKLVDKNRGVVITKKKVKKSFRYLSKNEQQ